MSVRTNTHGDVERDSKAARLVDKLEDTAGVSLREFFELSERPDKRVYWVPAWLAEDRVHAPHDVDLGAIVVGTPHRETEDAIKFNHVYHVMCVRTVHTAEAHHKAKTERYTHTVDEWEQTVREAVHADRTTVSLHKRRYRSRQYWPLSQLERVY